MISVTLDTNILISATIANGNEYDLLKYAKLGKIRLVLSLPILEEFKEVISRPKFGFAESLIKEIIKNIFDICEIVIPKEKIEAIKEDPDDNMVLECAKAGNVDYIVSGDKHLLNLYEYKEIKIIKTFNLLDIIKK